MHHIFCENFDLIFNYFAASCLISFSMVFLKFLQMYSEC